MYGPVTRAGVTGSLCSIISSFIDYQIIRTQTYFYGHLFRFKTFAIFRL